MFFGPFQTNMNTLLQVFQRRRKTKRFSSFTFHVIRLHVVAFIQFLHSFIFICEKFSAFSTTKKKKKTKQQNSTTGKFHIYCASEQLKNKYTCARPYKFLQKPLFPMSIFLPFVGNKRSFKFSCEISLGN